ncbi:MAG TPA: hypothetical protein VFE71_03555 [Bacteroidales bacterium]|nr:hypothetical protein [Bacteroidales bacterium]
MSESADLSVKDKDLKNGKPATDKTIPAIPTGSAFLFGLFSDNICDFTYCRRSLEIFCRDFYFILYIY